MLPLLFSHHFLFLIFLHFTCLIYSSPMTGLLSVEGQVYALLVLGLRQCLQLWSQIFKGLAGCEHVDRVYLSTPSAECVSQPICSSMPAASWTGGLPVGSLTFSS